MNLIFLILISITISLMQTNSAVIPGLSAANGGPGGWGGSGGNTTDGDAGSGGRGGAGGFAGNAWIDWPFPIRVVSTSSTVRSPPGTEFPTSMPPMIIPSNSSEPVSEAPSSEAPTSMAPNSEAPTSAPPSSAPPSTTMPTSTTTRLKTTRSISQSTASSKNNTVCRWCALWDGKYPMISGNFPMFSVKPKDLGVVDQNSNQSSSSDEDFSSNNASTLPSIDLSEQLPTSQTITQPSFK